MTVGDCQVTTIRQRKTCRENDSYKALLTRCLCNSPLDLHMIIY